jgi:hypothetical protein
MSGTHELGTGRNGIRNFLKRLRAIPFKLSTSPNTPVLVDVLQLYVRSQLELRVTQRLNRKGSMVVDRLLSSRATLFFEILDHVVDETAIIANLAAAAPTLLPNLLKLIYLTEDRKPEAAPQLRLLACLLMHPAFFISLCQPAQAAPAFGYLYLVVLSSPAQTQHLTELGMALYRLAHHDAGLRAKLVFVLRHLPEETHRQNTLEQTILRCVQSSSAEDLGVCEKCLKDYCTITDLPGLVGTPLAPPRGHDAYTSPGAVLGTPVDECL